MARMNWRGNTIRRRMRSHSVEPLHEDQAYIERMLRQSKLLLRDALKALPKKANENKRRRIFPAPSKDELRRQAAEAFMAWRDRQHP